jgi:signal transduction histidine kinase
VAVALERFVERASLSAVLRESGFITLESSTLEGVLRGIRERPVLCVLLDLSLPAAEGRAALDVCRELRRELRGGRPLGIVCMSASAQSHAAALEAGADAFLTLPADPAVLVATVRGVLRRNAASAGTRDRETFLAALSHKMRGPLNSISAWAQLLRSGRLAPDATDQALAAIVRGVHAETQILDDVLDLARISSGSAQLEARPLTLTTVLSGAIDSVDSSASSKGVEIRRPIPSQASVIGDAERLRQVFTNLLSNAIRFTPAGGYVEVEVDERDTEVEVRVNDTGQGIAPDVLPQLFERAAAASADLPVGGAGLGLSIVKSLVQRHGGAVRAASAGPGRGATFAVRLPITVTG